MLWKSWLTHCVLGNGFDASKEKRLFSQNNLFTIFTYRNTKQIIERAKQSKSSSIMCTLRGHWVEKTIQMQFKKRSYPQAWDLQ